MIRKSTEAGINSKIGDRSFGSTSTRSFFQSKSQRRAQAQKIKDESLGSEHDYADQDRSIGSEARSQNDIIKAQNLEILNQNIEIRRQGLSVLPHQQITTPTSSVKPPFSLGPSRTTEPSVDFAFNTINTVIGELNDQLKQEKIKREEAEEKARVAEGQLEIVNDQLKQEKIKSKEAVMIAGVTEGKLEGENNELCRQLNQEKRKSKSTKDLLDKNTEVMKELFIEQKKFQEEAKQHVEDKANYEKERTKLEKDKLVVENELLNIKREENKRKQKVLDLRSSLSSTKTRHAFLVANTYAKTTSLRSLPGTEKSIETVKESLKMFGFQTKVVLNKDFDELRKELDNWKSQSSQDRDLGTLLFYFCGHGGHLPFVCDNNAGDTNSTFFYGSTGSISLGGDFILDNKNKKMFKNQIHKTLCQVPSLVL